MPHPKIVSALSSPRRNAHYKSNNPLTGKVLLAVTFSIMGALLWLSTRLRSNVVGDWKTNINQDYAHFAAVGTKKQQDEHTFMSDLMANLNPADQCLDEDDPPAWHHGVDCACTAPTVPVERGSTRWTDFHQLMLKKVQEMINQPVPLDVLFLGDSITERWMGSKFLAKVQAPEFHQVFRQHFDRSTGASLQGAPFGGSGDTTQELWWHLQHGILASHVQPRVVLLLIGTNNVGRIGCSKTHTLAGILQLALFIQQQRPQATMIIHGLLPRNEEYGNGNYTVGYKWAQLQWINRQLEWFCSNIRKDWVYLDNGNLFLMDENTINATLMDDALHPTVEGYRLWGPVLVEQIHKVLDPQTPT